jgi:hypothetical protein
MHAAGESLVDGGDVGFGVFHDLFGDGLAGIGEFLGDECDLGFGLDGSEAVEGRPACSDGQSTWLYW